MARSVSQIAEMGRNVERIAGKEARSKVNRRDRRAGVRVQNHAMSGMGVHRARAFILVVAAALCAGCLTPYDPSFDYISVLRDSPPWENSRDPSFVPFSYQSASSAALAALDAKWSIHAKAGLGASFDRMLALMSWVNDVTTQDGGAPVPSPKTAENFLKLSTDGSGTKLNCLATATTLAEVLPPAGSTAASRQAHP